MSRPYHFCYAGRRRLIHWHYAVIEHLHDRTPVYQYGWQWRARPPVTGARASYMRPLRDHATLARHGARGGRNTAANIQSDRLIDEEKRAVRQTTAWVKALLPPVDPP